MNDRSFNDYLIFLRDSVACLAEYWQKTGHHHTVVKDIAEGLSHKDPFVTYKASIAATLLLEDKSIYH